MRAAKKVKCRVTLVFGLLTVSKKVPFLTMNYLCLGLYVYTKLFVFKLKGTKTLKESFWI